MCEGINLSPFITLKSMHCKLSTVHCIITWESRLGSRLFDFRFVRVDSSFDSSRAASRAPSHYHSEWGSWRGGELSCQHSTVSSGILAGYDLGPHGRVSWVPGTIPKPRTLRSIFFLIHPLVLVCLCMPCRHLTLNLKPELLWPHLYVFPLDKGVTLANVMYILFMHWLWEEARG